jgi:hypothetical protein
MKLRATSSSIRLRLSQSDVKKYRDDGVAEEVVKIGSSEKNNLRYRLVADKSVKTVTATFANNELTVAVPVDAARRWTESDEVGIEAVQSLSGAGQLHILIEKDFACLTTGDGADDRDAFPNPAAKKPC